VDKETAIDDPREDERDFAETDKAGIASEGGAEKLDENDNEDDDPSQGEDYDVFLDES
jgi:hypothetical protein